MEVCVHPHMVLTPLVYVGYVFLEHLVEGSDEERIISQITRTFQRPDI